MGRFARKCPEIRGLRGPNGPKRHRKPPGTWQPVHRSRPYPASRSLTARRHGPSHRPSPSVGLAFRGNTPVLSGLLSAMSSSKERVMGGLISQWVAAFAQRLRELGWIEGISSTNVALVSIRTVSIALLSLLPATSAHSQGMQNSFVAFDLQNSFVEFKEDKETTTYDLRTVEIIQPGKFVIVETVLDNPDVMRFGLKVLDTLRSHCARQEGSYPAPAEVFTLGPPDMIVKKIEVSVSRLSTLHPNYRYKIASWWLPYFKTMIGTGAGYESYRCNPPGRTETEEYVEHRDLILNGLKTKVLFDCNRGLRGEFLNEDENDYRKARVHPIKNGTVGAEYYNGVCRAVTRKAPYISE